MSSKREPWRMRLVRRLVLVMAPVLALVAGTGAQQECPKDQELGLSLDFSTNRTGHQLLKAVLRQPIKVREWQLDVELGTSQCNASDAAFEVLEIYFTGLPKIKVPPTYVSLQQLGYYRHPAEIATWQKAREQCASEGAAIALPASQAEMDTLVSVFRLNETAKSHSNEIYLGASDIAVEGTFVTIQGEPLALASSLAWTSGEPGGGRSQNCLAYDIRHKSLYDRECSQERPYVCKYILN